MITSSSSFTTTSLALSHNGVKSAIFRAAEILMGLFIYKLFSLIAAQSNKFTSYIMFAEDYIQRCFFISSRGFSRASLIVLLFTILNLLASLYGTFLWALDSPGYVFRNSNHAVAEYKRLLKKDPPYVVQLKLDPDNLQSANDTLAKTLGADLFESGLNYTLTGEVRRGSPETTTPMKTSSNAPARIWLDDEGFSVSPDSSSWLPTIPRDDPDEFPLDCWEYGTGAASWSCTFNNSYSESFIKNVLGQPDVHWDEKSSEDYDYRKIRPSRLDNIWSTFGLGGGSTVMKQLFTVTKGTRRHTFVESVFRATMLANTGQSLAAAEVGDLVQRSWNTTGKGIDGFLPEQITKDMLKAQEKHLSYHAGASITDNGGLSVLQSSWGLFNLTNPVQGANIYTLIILTSTNITLLRSETIAKEPEPLGSCSQGSFQNEAFGGKVTQNDCSTSKPSSEPARFFGQVDTGAVLIVYGLGNGRSNISSVSLSENVLRWTQSMSTRMEDLLVARGYVISVDPALVTVTVERLIVGISPLQLFLTLLTVVLAGGAWTWLAFSKDGLWSNSFFANVIQTTSGGQQEQGYMHNPPHVEISPNETSKVITVSGRAVLLQDSSMISMNTFSQAYPSQTIHMASFAPVPQRAAGPNEQFESDTSRLLAGYSSYAGKY